MNKKSIASFRKKNETKKNHVTFFIRSVDIHECTVHLILYYWKKVLVHKYIQLDDLLRRSRTQRGVCVEDEDVFFFIKCIEIIRGEEATPFISYNIRKLWFHCWSFHFHILFSEEKNVDTAFSGFFFLRNEIFFLSIRFSKY